MGPLFKRFSLPFEFKVLNFFMAIFKKKESVVLVISLVEILELNVYRCPFALGDYLRRRHHQCVQASRVHSTSIPSRLTSKVRYRVPVGSCILPSAS